MSKFAGAGVLSCLFGLLTIGYQGIKSLMDAKTGYQVVHIIDLFDADFIDQMDSARWHGFQSMADWLLDKPLYAAFLVVGGILLLVSTFFWKR